MKTYLANVLKFLIAFGIGFGIMMLSSELLASPDNTAFWLGLLLTIVIALIIGYYISFKLKTWFQEALDKIENEKRY